MSQVAISGNASGTGTLTIAAPNTNSNYTLTLPTQTGTVMVGGPAFSAYLGGATQSVTTGVSTKAILDTEDFDSGGCFNNTGSTVSLNGLSVPSYSFCPNVAGYYQFNLGMRPAATTGVLSAAYISIFKNGTEYYRLYEQAFTPTGGAYGPINASILMYLNGTGDYVGFYTVLSGTSPKLNNDGTQYTTRMNGSMVRAA
jgi:hypothetical protein